MANNAFGLDWPFFSIMAKYRFFCHFFIKLDIIYIAFFIFK